MIRQICPHCYQTVSLADDAAGTTLPCPSCGQTFAVPGKYTPTVDPGLAPEPPIGFAPPPPGLVTPPPPTPPAVPRLTEATAVPGPASATGHTGSPERGVRLTLSPKVVEWLPVVGFTLVALLTFFSWVGLYPGGYKAYAQSPWYAVMGWIDTNFFSEQVLKLETKLHELTHSNWVILLPYLIGVFLAAALAWADRLTSMNAFPAVGQGRVAHAANQFRPHYAVILAGLAAGLLILLALQLWVGFGLENALNEYVSTPFNKRLEDATNSAARQTVYVERGMELGKYHVQGTVWLTLAFFAHLLALVGSLLRLWLARRGNRALPRLNLEW